MPAGQAELSTLQGRSHRHHNHEGEACAEVSGNLSALSPIQESKTPTQLAPAFWASTRAPYAGAVKSGTLSGR